MYDREKGRYTLYRFDARVLPESASRDGTAPNASTESDLSKDNSTVPIQAAKMTSANSSSSSSKCRLGRYYMYDSLAVDTTTSSTRRSTDTRSKNQTQHDSLAFNSDIEPVSEAKTSVQSGSEVLSSGPLNSSATTNSETLLVQTGQSDSTVRPKSRKRPVKLIGPGENVRLNSEQCVKRQHSLILRKPVKPAKTAETERLAVRYRQSAPARQPAGQAESTADQITWFEEPTAKTPEATRIAALTEWPAARIENLQQRGLPLIARGAEGGWWKVPPLITTGHGIPQGPLQAVSEEEVKANGHLLIHAWCLRKIRSGHPNTRFPESLEFCASRPDPVVFESPTTEHIPVMHFHHAQRERCRLAGIHPPIAEGPSQYGPFNPMPRCWEDLFIQPSHGPSKWGEMEQWFKEAARQIGNVQRGMRYKTDGFPGGKEGLEFGVEHIKPPYGCVQWKDVNGVPVIVTPDLPDSACELRLQKMYEVQMRMGLKDKEIASEIPLYGVGEKTSIQPKTGLYHNYSGAWTHNSVLLKDRNKKLDRASPRLIRTSMSPPGWPLRCNARSVIEQPKPGGKIKYRPINDAGSKRKKRRLITEAVKKISRSEKLTDIRNELRDIRSKERIAEQQPAEAAVRSYLAKKGDPGDDSANACTALHKSERAECKYGNISKFTESIDILMSSGLPVDILQDDFASYYELWPLPWVLQWCGAQIVSDVGADIGCVADFGIEYFPNKLNRSNFNVEFIIAIRARQKMKTFCWTPYSPEVRQKAETFLHRRRVFGCSGDFFALYPWFDDNTCAVLQFFRTTMQRLRYDTWREFALEWAPEKAAHMVFGCKQWTPVTGFDLKALERTRSLPKEKVKNYTDLLQQICSDANDQHESLISQKVVDSMMGKLSHAVDAVPSLWDDFISLVVIFGSQSFRKYKKVTRQAREHIRAAMVKMKEENGTPFTSYVSRPGEDNLPVWMSHTDASLRVPSYFAAAGGWFRLFNSNWIFFFTYQWSTEEARICGNIGELEWVANDIVAELQFQVHCQLGGSKNRDDVPSHYLIMAGDNSGVFDDSLNSMRAYSRGMRFLARQRARKERSKGRISHAKQTDRHFNKAADALANVDIPAFEREIRKLVPHARLCRLHVPERLASLENLNNWNAAWNS